MSIGCAKIHLAIAITSVAVVVAVVVAAVVVVIAAAAVWRCFLQRSDPKTTT